MWTIKNVDVTAGGQYFSFNFYAKKNKYASWNIALLGNQIVYKLIKKFLNVVVPFGGV